MDDILEDNNTHLRRALQDGEAEKGAANPPPDDPANAEADSANQAAVAAANQTVNPPPNAEANPANLAAVAAGNQAANPPLMLLPMLRPILPTW